MKKIIATGKGGVGKTTIIATLAILLARDGYRVLVIDTDPSMNLAISLGMPFSKLATLADHKTEVREMLGADGDEEDEEHVHGELDDKSLEEIISGYTMMTPEKIRVMVMGTIPYGGAGCICSSISLVRLAIGAIERKNASLDFIIVDSQAGSEVLGRGLAADYDLNLIVTESTPGAMDVARHVMRLASDIGVKKQIVIVNKVEEFTEVHAVADALGVAPDDIYPVACDRKVYEADRQARLVLDYAPESMVITNIKSIEDAIVL
jgi:CO dehydrogenase maturation factor